jgi:hypothetical protein
MDYDEEGGAGDLKLDEYGCEFDETKEEMEGEKQDEQAFMENFELPRFAQEYRPFL